MSKIRTCLAILAGSVAVHFVVACGSSAASRVGAALDAGAPLADALADGFSTVDGAIDTPTAEASPSGASGYTVHNLTCENSTVSVTASGLKESLAGSIAIMCAPAGTTTVGGFPPGFACEVVPVYVRDGAVGALCPETSWTAEILIPSGSAS